MQKMIEDMHARRVVLVIFHLLGFAASLEYDCSPNDSIIIKGFSANTNFYAKQGATLCTVSPSGTTSVTITITGCLKDQEVLLTYGSYSQMSANQLHGGKSVNAVKITCSEIPVTGNLHSINNAFAASLIIDETQTIDPSYQVTSSLSSTNVNVGDAVTWTIAFPVEYFLEVTQCYAYPGIDDTSSDNIQLISLGGCFVSDELISNFGSSGSGSVSAVIQAFKFYDNANVYLECDLKVCPTTDNCVTSCPVGRRKREIGLSKRSDQKSSNETKFYPGRIHNILTITEPLESSAMAVTPFIWSVAFSITVISSVTGRIF